MLDTKYYLANHPQAFSLQAACLAPGTADAMVLNQSMFWPVLLEQQILRGGTVHQVDQGLASI
ncbi:allantoicase [compost metagenome]